MTNLVPDVSVIIATHNRLWSLPQAIDSCRGSRCRTEIIVVDDGSADGTWEWLSKQRDVTAIRMEHWGKCWAVNAGLAAANGEFVRFLDSDDWLLPGANDSQLELARQLRADLVLAGQVRVEDDSMRRSVSSPPLHIDDVMAQYVESVAQGRDISYGAFLMRRALAERIPHRQEFPWDDVMFMIEIVLTDPQVAVDGKLALSYREHARDQRVSCPRGEAEHHTIRANVIMYQRTLELLRRRGIAKERRVHAVLNATWVQARKLADWDLAAASEAVDWIYEQDASFEPAVSDGLARLYRLLGFSRTEQLARVRRRLVRGLGL